MLSTPAKKDRLYSFEQDRRVKRQTLVLDVVKVVLQLLLCVFDRGAVWILDLRPAGQPRRDQVPLFVVVNFPGQLRHKMWPLWSRADKVHVPTQNVPKLWYLIDANFVNDSTVTRNSFVFTFVSVMSVFFI